MKNKIVFLSLLLSTAVFLLSFNFTNNNKLKSKQPESCNCGNVQNVQQHMVGSTLKITWDPPSGGDPVSSYGYGGELGCDGPFSGTVSGTEADIPNPDHCAHGNIRIRTNCTNGCISGGTLYSW